MQNTAKQNYPGSTASYDTRPGNDVGLFRNTTEPTRGCTRRNWACVFNTSWPLYILKVKLNYQLLTDQPINNDNNWPNTNNWQVKTVDTFTAHSSVLGT